MVGIPVPQRSAVDVSPLHVCCHLRDLALRVYALLFPDYESFRGYFYGRKRWIFLLIVLLFVVDLADTLLKGSAYLACLWVDLFPA